MTSPTLLAFSNELAAAIAQVSPSLLGLQTKRPKASGVYWRSNVVVTTVDAVHRRDDVELITANGTVSAQVRGRDAGTDIAVLQTEVLDLPTAELTDADGLQPGHLSLALGRSGDGCVRASLGILSSVGDPWQSWTGGYIDRFIRPDIAPFPSFAGGALLDIQGRVLGINTTYSRGRFPVTIPAKTVDRVVNQLLQQGRIAQAYLGIVPQPTKLMDNIKQSLNLTQGSGILIASLEEGGAADAAGVMVGDILFTLNGEAIASQSQLQSQLNPDLI
ncbi:MAG: S1C family serine protease, partial [Elainellaceae cyanobacterium]